MNHLLTKNYMQHKHQEMSLYTMITVLDTPLKRAWRRCNYFFLCLKEVVILFKRFSFRIKRISSNQPPRWQRWPLHSFIYQYLHLHVKEIFYYNCFFYTQISSDSILFNIFHFISIIKYFFILYELFKK